MFKTMLAGAIAVAIAGSSVAYAQYRGGPDEPRHWRHSGERGSERWRPSAEDLGAFTDARIAALKAGLRLNPAQEPHWPSFEQALRERAKLRAERLAALGDAARSDGPDNPVARMQRRADMMVRHAGAMKQVADAAAPLYQSLDEAQKRRFVVLARPLGPRHHFGPRWRGRGHDEERDGRDGPRPGRHMGPGFRL